MPSGIGSPWPGSPTSAPTDATDACRWLAEELAAESEAVVPELIEVVVINGHDPVLPYNTEWAAERPLKHYYAGPRDLNSYAPDQIGTILDADEDAWFLAVTDEYRAANFSTSPNAVGIPDDAGEISRLLYIRTIVPQ